MNRTDSIISGMLGLFKILILVTIITIVSTKERRRKPPVKVSERNGTETFYAKVVSDHIRYCTNGRVCENRRYKACDVCEQCYCDEACFEFGDCCPDKGLRQSYPQNSGLECVSPLVESLYPSDIFNSRKDIEDKYAMIVTCPHDDSNLQFKCYNSITLPVSSMDNTTTFRNKHCATCHNITNIRPWQILVKCTASGPKDFKSTSELVEEVINDENCSIKFQAPDGVIERTCHLNKDTISQCNVTGLWPQYDEFLDKACSSYQTVKEVGNQTFRNPFCFICNTDQPRLLFTQSPCKRRPTGLPPSFTALLDFSDLLRDKDEVIKSECPPQNIYDTDKKICRQITCSFGREINNGTCRSFLGRSRGTAYKLYFSLNLDEEIPLSGSEGLLDDLPASLNAYFASTYLKEANHHGEVFAFNRTSQYGNCSDFTKQILFSTTLVTVKDVYQDEFESRLLSLRNISFWLYNGVREFNFTTRVSMEAGKLEHSNQKSNSASCAIAKTVSYDIDSFDGNYVPVDGLLLCPQIILEKDEFFLDQDASLFLEWKSEPIEYDNFQVVDDNKVKICLSDFKPNAREILDGSLRKKPSYAESIVSMVCTTLSLLCLLISFVVYCAFRPLRSLPGKNNMNLIVTLFLAQLLYLVGAGRTEIVGVCEAMAIFIHYFWLAAFCAMNVCSFHMFRVFTSMRCRDDESDMRRRFLQYSIYIYGMPAVLVTTTLVAYIVTTNGSDIGYGGAICFLASDIAIALAFGIPVAVTIVSNSSFFIITLRSIRNRPKIEKSKQDEQHAMVYIKLSTLTGITWTLGFLAIITGIQVLSYLFILINASQGIFLFISFVCNERVKKLISQNGRESGIYSRTGTAKTNTTVNTVSVGMDCRLKVK